MWILRLFLFLRAEPVLNTATIKRLEMSKEARDINGTKEMLNF